jgi:carbonic anhydrase
MEEAAQFADETQIKVMSRTPAQVLGELQKGTARFWTGEAARPEKSAFERRGLIAKQFPSVAVLGCADSRVPVEIIFDQGLGDIFTVRVAGNCLDTSTHASLQYAVKHLKVKVLLVLGHESCGAVKAASAPDTPEHPDELRLLLKNVREGLPLDSLKHITDERARDREAVVANVRNQVTAITQDDCIMDSVRSGDLVISGAFYGISSGIVDFFAEVSDTECASRADPPGKVEEVGKMPGEAAPSAVQLPNLLEPVRPSTPPGQAKAPRRFGSRTSGASEEKHMFEKRASVDRAVALSS